MKDLEVKEVEPFDENSMTDKEKEDALNEYKEKEEVKTAQVNMGKEPPFGETTEFENMGARFPNETFDDYKLRQKREHYNFKNRRKNNFLHTSKYVEPAKKDGTKQKVYGDGTKRGSFKDEKETK